MSLLLSVGLALGACGPGGGAGPSIPAPPVSGSVTATSSAPKPEGAAPPSSAPGPSRGDAELAKAAQEYLDLLVDISPEEATALGLHKNDALLDDRTIVGEDKALEREEALAKSLRERFKGVELGPAGKTDLAMLLGALDTDVRTRRVQRPLQRMPSIYASPLGAIFMMTARDYAPAADRARNVVARLEKIPKVIEAAKANLLNPPKVWTEVGIDRAGSARAFLEAQRPFLTASLPSEGARIDAALKTAEAAYDDYKKFLQKEILPKSNGRFAAGRELFEFLLANDYFLDEKADDLLAMGRKLFAETNAQMTTVAKRIDPAAKGWPEVVARLKGNHPTADGLLDAYRSEVKRARVFLAQKDAVEFPPGDDLEVIDTPPFLRSTITAAYDQPPPFDATTKGFFFVTPVDKTLSKAKQEEMLRENDHGDLVDTAVHEAYPGHHLQLSFARRHPSLVRKVIHPSIFSEGWALYSEELMAELGYYTDEERLLQLEWTLVRAARIVLDVGLHVQNMELEDAVKKLTDEVHLEKTLALSEAKRYSMTPTQPLAYLTGRQMIFKMRERAKQRDGANFSLKRFHTEVLTRGTVSPSLMSREIFGP
ncbi:MAG: DUF885 domain-containing protein [Deltaproteobacteria bacterium]|nr:DUF885 domain-containing protein [Deltaproteobacteria bacterium]